MYKIKHLLPPYFGSQSWANTLSLITTISEAKEGRPTWPHRQLFPTVGSIGRTAQMVWVPIILHKNYRILAKSTCSPASSISFFFRKSCFPLVKSTHNLAPSIRLLGIFMKKPTNLSKWTRTLTFPVHKNLQRKLLVFTKSTWRPGPLLELFSLWFSSNQITTRSIRHFFTSNIMYNLNTKAHQNQKLFNIKFDKKIRKLQLYCRTNFKIQNAFAISSHKCLRAILSTNNLKTSSNKKMYKKLLKI